MKSPTMCRPLILALGISSLIACGESRDASPVGLDARLAKGGGDDGPAATLTFRDAPEDGLRSDGAGAYVDGSDRVEVAITDGDFHFKPATHRNGPRWVELTLTEVDDPDPFAGETQQLGYFTDFRVHEGLLWVPCDEVPRATIARLAWQPRAGQSGYKLHFGNPAVGGESDSVTVVRRAVDAAASEWTIESAGRGFLESGTTPLGTFHVPFLMTVGGPGC